MGFVPKKKIYKITFEDGDLDGLEVRATSASLGQFMEITELADLADAGVATMSPDQVRKVGQLYESFAECLVSWNIETEGGSPVPATVAGLHSQDFGLVNEILKEWMSAVAGASAPKEQPSNDGELSAVASIPTEIGLPSLAS